VVGADRALGQDRRQPGGQIDRAGFLADEHAGAAARHRADDASRDLGRRPALVGQEGVLAIALVRVDDAAPPRARGATG
jgi:hypothetical protein